MLEIPPYHSYFLDIRFRSLVVGGRGSSRGGSSKGNRRIPGKSEINEALLVYEGEFDKVIDDKNKMPGAEWFRGIKLNYAENLLKFNNAPFLLKLSKELI